MWLHSVAWRALRSTVEPHALALAQLPALDRERDRLVVAEPVDVLDARRAGVALDDAGVGDLAAALRVEGDSRGTSSAARRRRAARAPTLVSTSVVS